MRIGEIDEAGFDSQMWLLREFFNPLPLNLALDLQKSNDLPPASVCVTFDDGYADNADVALPILQKWQIPATFFVSSGFLDGGRMWNDTILESFKTLASKEVDLSAIGLGCQSVETHGERRRAAHKVIDVLKYRPPDQRNAGVRFIASLASDLPDNLMMTSLQVKQLVHAGMDIGAHTVNHPILTALDPDEARREIREGKNTLETLTGRPIVHFAYPNGKPGRDYSEYHKKLLPELGFNAAVSTHWGVSTAASDIWELPRFTPWDRHPAKFLLRMIRNYQNVQ